MCSIFQEIHKDNELYTKLLIPDASCLEALSQLPSRFSQKWSICLTQLKTDAPQTPVEIEIILQSSLYSSELPQNPRILEETQEGLIKNLFKDGVETIENITRSLEVLTEEENAFFTAHNISSLIL
ncbi:unnamed protein product [Moneuplotes crassus]|uniref:Uncharacterized protein n=1 Tax=Euplotes crassus TaxID=5936 RepID=A0AAD1UBS0_EUPCR|nr:unnamed protein product [Moneuplotes crassus]